MKARKKPITIECFQFHVQSIPDWFMNKVTTNDIILYDDHCLINTKEGVMRGDDKDYIIKGVIGEIYPCKPDIFENTYDLEGAGNSLQRMETVLELARPLLKWLNENCHPHTKIIINPTNVEVVEGVLGIPCEDYLVD